MTQPSIQEIAEALRLAVLSNEEAESLCTCPAPADRAHDNSCRWVEHIRCWSLVGSSAYTLATVLKELLPAAEEARWRLQSYREANVIGGTDAEDWLAKTLDLAVERLGPLVEKHNAP